MSDKDLKRVKIEIQLDEETAQGVYANMAVVNHTDAEFVLDFVYVQPGVPRARVRNRVITSPRHIKRLIHVLQENMDSYEEKFGPVDPLPAAPAVLDDKIH